MSSIGSDAIVRQSNGYIWDVTTLAWVPDEGGAVRAGAGATSVVGDSATSVTLLAANASRLGATVYNTSTATLFVKLGATATTAAGGYAVAMVQNSYYEVPFAYTGIIDGIWAADAGGAASVTELS